MKSRLNRRGFFGFLASMATFVGAMVGGSLGLIAIAREKWVSVGMVEDFEVGKAILIEGEKLYIFRGEDGLRAMSAKCTHMGCIIDRVEDGTYQCPCHGAEYDDIGSVTRGPTKKDLPWYEVKIEGGEVLVNKKGEIEIDK